MSVRRGASYLMVPLPPPTPVSPLVSLLSYFMVPHPPPTPAPPLVGEPIVEGYNIKTDNFYEIKVDF